MYMSVLENMHWNHSDETFVNDEDCKTLTENLIEKTPLLHYTMTILMKYIIYRMPCLLQRFSRVRQKTARVFYIHEEQK